MCIILELTSSHYDRFIQTLDLYLKNNSGAEIVVLNNIQGASYMHLQIIFYVIVILST